MATKLPYVNLPGSIVKILEKAKQAKTPDRFTHDFLTTKLKFKGGNYAQFIPLAKKLGLLKSDGTPTDLYKKFRNNESSGAAIAEALKIAYREVFERNEYANNLTAEQFKGLVLEITGLEQKNRIVQLVCQTFNKLKSLADFDLKLPEDSSDSGDSSGDSNADTGSQDTSRNDLGLNLSYTINLVLPKTDDPAVFNAIFKSLRDNLLRK